MVGADKWRNPDEDQPQDFEARRAENYRELRKQMTAELTLLNDRMPKLSWLDIAERKSGGSGSRQPRPSQSRATCAGSRARYRGGGARCR